MRILFTAILLMALSLSARENPFFPSTGEADIPFTTNEQVELEPLKRAAISLPSTARTIESITVKYKNLDGSIEEKTESLGNSVDWHLPLFISQNIADGTENKKIKEKEIFTKVAGLKFITLYESKKRFKIVTKDKMIRNFLLTKPHRIVCDFKRDIDLRSYEKAIKFSGKIKNLRVGNHKGYYRIVIELDGYYRYKLQTIQDGYTFSLR